MSLLWTARRPSSGDVGGGIAALYRRRPGGGLARIAGLGASGSTMVRRGPDPGGGRTRRKEGMDGGRRGRLGGAGGLGAACLAAFSACLPGAPRHEVDLVVLYPQARAGAEAPSLDLGSDASLPALVSGWGPRARAGDGAFQWGQGEGSELRFGVGEPRDLELRLRGWPLAFDGAPPQSVEVRANGQTVATLALAPGAHDYPVQVPAAALVPGENRLALRYAWARAPRDVVPGSSERRALAVAWDSLRIPDARRHGAPGAEPEAAEPALRLPLASWVDYYLRVPDGSRLRIPRLEPFGPAIAPALQVVAEPAGAPPQVARFEPGRAVDLALPPAGGGPMRISLRALGSAEPGAEAGLRLLRPALDEPAAAPDAAPPRTAPVSGRRPSVVLYLIDTLRADHLGAYGYPRPTSPRIDAFARDATLFRNAFAQSSWTKPAVASLFTGLLPQTHRINPRPAALPEALPSLPEILRDRGYATFGVVANGNVSSAFGFARGFDA